MLFFLPQGYMNHPLTAPHGGELLTTTLPFPTKCHVLQRWYAAFKSQWSRWHRSVFPRPQQQQAHPKKLNMVITYDELVRMSLLAKKHSTAVCRTKAVDVMRLTKGMRGVHVVKLETHGGMGRIYALEDPTKLLKVADLRRSWCKYEAQNYQVLTKVGLPCAKVWASHTQMLDNDVYIVTVIERLDFTLSSYIRAAGRLNKPPKHIIGLLVTLLDALDSHKIVFGDLSPDNIMFRNDDDDRYSLVLIDPQFAVPAAEFQKKMPEEKAKAFDKTYLALKIQAIGFSDPPVHRFADAVCAGILGHTPLEKHTRRWLMHEAPVGLFMAYDILRTAN